MTSLLWLAHLHHKKICCSRYSSFMFDLFCTTHAGCHRSNATWQMCLSLDRLHVCTLFTDLQHYKLLLSRRVLESICWLSTFAKTLKTNRVLMSATHLKNPRFWVPYLSVPIFSLPLAFCFGEHTQWYKVKPWVDSFTKITLFVTRTSNCCLYSQECGSGLTTILDKRPWDSTASAFSMCRFYLWRRDSIPIYKDGQRKGKVF